MEKLELKHLAPYLPYNIGFVEKNKIETIIGYKGDAIFIEGGHKSGYCQVYEINTLALRPMSDLTKEITVYVKKFIPIVELYRLSNEYNYNQDLNYEFIDSWGSGKILKIWIDKSKDEYTEFIYSDFSFRKDTRRAKGSNVFGMDLPHPIRLDNKIHNQQKLFDKLFEWHFDVFGLIKKGLAISLNDLS